MKRIVFAIIAVIMLSLVILFVKRTNYKDNSFIANINGEPISIAELKNIMDRNRAVVYNYFAQKYGVYEGAYLWTASYDGEVPLEMIKEKSLKQCIKIKIQQILAKEKGIIEDISYSTFLDNLNKENERRKRALKARKVIYGPVEFSEQTYFNHSFSIMVIQLKGKLATEHFALSETKIRQYYDNHKNNFYKRQDIVKICKISIPFCQNGAKEKSMDRDDAKALIETIKAKLDNNEESFEALARIYNKNASIAEQIFDESTAPNDERFFFKLKKPAMQLSVGEVSEVIKDEAAFHIIKCIERKDGGYITFDDIREIVKSNCIDEKYQELIDKLVANAKIKINRSVYNSISVQ